MSFQSILAFLQGLHPAVLYVVLGVGAGIENVVPPVPADTFVLLGGFLTAGGRVGPVGVFLATWGCNVASALAVYGVGRRYGRAFFSEGWGRHLLTPHQLGRMQGFYARWGILAIFFTRFLPGFRAVVPAFAGVSRLPFLPVAIPLTVASALWYGALVWLGATAGRNLDRILGWIGDANLALLVVAGIIAVAVGVWWYRTRHTVEP
ncbi:MAG: DedA family protein [Gemmatimonadetes bacterium]|nr:DedA family protein [Gemmatimonadota bacterium]